MSFFPVQKRNLSVIQDTTQLGPGKYNVSYSPQNKRSYAPFGSCSSKKQKNKMRNIDKIGPGSYNISKPIGQPSISKYQSQKCVIIKINDQGSSQFRSSTKRFDQMKKNSLTPGPGSYQNNYGHTVESKRRKTCSVGSMVNMRQKIRQLNNYLYNQRRKPTIQTDPIMPQYPRQQKLNKNKSQSAKGVVSWNLNKKQRFQPLVYQPFTQFDKNQIIQKIKQEKQAKKKMGKKPMGIFQSRSVKSHIECSMYQTNNPYKMQIRKLLNYKDPGPAPGSYEVQGNIGKPVRNKYQFFGSSSDRFGLKIEVTQDIGPGYYYRQHSADNRKNRRNKTLSIKNFSKQQRGSYINADASIPGPGTYQLQVQKKFGVKKVADVFKTGSFGSVQQRFPQPKIFVPFKPQNELKAEDQDLIRAMRHEQQFQYRKKLRQNHASSVFVSIKDRDCFEQNKHKKQIPFAEYQTSNYDISTKTKKYNELISQLQDCKLQRPPFNSSVQRFKTECNEQSQHKNCFCLIKSIEKKPCILQSSTFKSKTPKAAIFEVKNKGPGVGQYQNKNNIVKGSFNSKFMNKAAIKKKKIDLWQKQKQRKSNKDQNLNSSNHFEI